MSSRRSYNDGCGTAVALDLVGERWALLVVRELLLGPKRFTDLRAGVPGASPNVLSQRLKELEDAEVVQRRRLGPPASTQVYELTQWGKELEPLLLNLGKWASRSPEQWTTPYRSPDSLMLWVKARFDPSAAQGLNATYAFSIDDSFFTVRVAHKRISIDRNPTDQADVQLTADLVTMSEVLKGQETLAHATSDNRLRRTGSAETAKSLIRALTNPLPAASARK
jgi:DNA-binding HxlR family transcriptional regulator